MNKGTLHESKIALPLVIAPPGQAPEGEAEWQGWRSVGELPAALRMADDAPEPLAPQGEYSQAEAVLELPAIRAEGSMRPVELLAPAGGMEAALAAFHFGADAVYLGLKKFSARAEAENFTLEEVEEITAFAHSSPPATAHPNPSPPGGEGLQRRRVFVTVNTLVRQDELAEVVADVARLADIGVDAIILQDLGVYHLLRRYFPQVELHGSTQMAVHNRAGAEALHQLGFRRVVLARELTFEEVDDITATAGVETEVFIHGALCYSYSGLCLFSSQTLGRSGNRGKCAYSCRDSFEVTGAPLTLRDGTEVRRDPGQGFPFSMKDLALPDHLPALRAAGVSCFKVEGRKKSPLYVATTTDYYRRLLDGTLDEADRPIVEKDIQTVFSRPWTRLFVQSHKDKEVADRDTVGHRGTLIGKVERVIPASGGRQSPDRASGGRQSPDRASGGHQSPDRASGGRQSPDRASGVASAPREPRLRFRTDRALQKHDGLQIDLPVLGKPFGFAVEHLWVVAAERGQVNASRSGERGHVNALSEVFEAPAGSLVEVSLPREHPELPAGAPVYCSSSQDVKQRYHYDHPREGEYRNRKGIHVEFRLTETELIAIGRVEEVAVQVARPGPFQEAREPGQMEKTLADTFSRLGDTRFTLEHIAVHNSQSRFVPVSLLNQVRRELVEKLEQSLRQSLADNIAALQAEIIPRRQSVAPTVTGFRWSIKVDRIGFLDAFTRDEFSGMEEAIIEIARDPWTTLENKLDDLAEKFGREKIRLALPPLTRRWEDKPLRFKIDQLRQAGWRKWEAANLSAWSYLGLDPEAPNADAIDLATDWSIYVLNRLAARQLLDMGVTRFTLSPEDGLGNLRPLLAEFAPQATVIVYQDTPLFLAESCAYANLIGGCPGKANCRFESMDMVSSHGERVTALDYHCRTIVLNQGPFCLSPHLAELARAGAMHLRADFVYRKYEPEQVRDVWQLVHARKRIPESHAANFRRGIL